MKPAEKVIRYKSCNNKEFETEEACNAENATVALQKLFEERACYDNLSPETATQVVIENMYHIKILIDLINKGKNKV